MYRSVLAGSLTLASLLAPPVRAQEALPDNPLAASDGPQPVLTPTRLKQAPRDVPASVTVMSADALGIYGLLGVNEAVRMVAGTVPQRLAGSNYDLKLPKLSTTGPLHVTVLIDGVQVGQDALGDDDDWTDIPISIDDVERIEVTRGPGTAGYGGAMTMAIINIVTKHPEDIERAFGRVTAGAYDTLRGLARAGMSVGRGAVRLTLAHRQRGEVTDDRSSSARPDPMSVDRMTLRSSFALDGVSNLSIDAAYLTGRRDGDETGTPPLGRQGLRAGYASVNWTRSLDPANELTLRLDQWANTLDTDVPACGGGAMDAWTAAAPRADLSRLVPAAKAEDCRGLLTYQRRMRLELQDVHVFGNGLRVVGGVGWRQEQARLRDPDLARWSTSFRRAFLAAEWEAVPDVEINVGASVDDGAAENYDRSMRAGVNWRVSADETLRAAWSVGDWASDKGSTLGLATNKVGVVTQERMQAWDLGYLLTLPERNATLEGRLYWTRLKGRVWNLKTPDRPDQARGEIYGAELRATGNVSDHWSGFIGVSTMIEGSNTGPADNSGHRPWSAGVGASVDLGAGWRASAAYYGSTRLNTETLTAGRADLVLLKDFRWDEARGRALLTYRRADHVKVMAADGKTILDPNGTADTYFVSFQVAY